MVLNRVSVKDQIEEFIPRGKVHFVILGTMASRIARSIADEVPLAPFYYHSPHNHFWKVLTLALSPEEAQPKTNEEKKNFLGKHGIAMANIVAEFMIAKNSSKNPSDKILFEAFKAKRLKFKVVGAELKKLLTTRPVFFTCLGKAPILELLEGFYSLNRIDDSFRRKIIFLKSPTRCNPKQRAREWKSVIVPPQNSVENRGE